MLEVCLTIPQLEKIVPPIFQFPLIYSLYRDIVTNRPLRYQVIYNIENILTVGIFSRDPCDVIPHTPGYHRVKSQGLAIAALFLLILIISSY